MKKLFTVALLLFVSACGVINLSLTSEKVKRVAWTRRAQTDLDSLWKWSEEEGNELAICLHGQLNISGTAIHVRYTEPPRRERLLTSNQAQVECYGGDDFLGIAHTHPAHTPTASPQDLRTLNENQFLLITIICGEHCRTSYKTNSDYPIEEIR